jgi:hypothetical protein
LDTFQEEEATQEIAVGGENEKAILLRYRGYGCTTGGDGTDKSVSKNGESGRSLRGGRTNVVPEGTRIERAVARRSERRRLADASVIGPGMVDETTDDPYADDPYAAGIRAEEKSAAVVLDQERNVKHYFCMCNVGNVFDPTDETKCTRLATWSASYLYYYDDASENVGEGASAPVESTLPTRGR